MIQNKINNLVSIVILSLWNKMLSGHKNEVIKRNPNDATALYKKMVVGAH